jgi:hypothetical protein
MLNKDQMDLIEKHAKLLEIMTEPVVTITHKTLRDEFAMAALPVFLTYEIDPKSIAEYCYAQADAMMEARK